MVYWVAIDGGGTKTEAILLDDSKKILAKASGGPSNVNKLSSNLEEGVAKAWDTIKELINDLCNTADIDLCLIKKICFGLAGLGIGNSEQKQFMKNKLIAEGLYEFCLLKSDAELQFLGNFPDKPGILVISGTGSIVIGLKNRKKETKLERAGGWGPFIGDHGSGYAIGQRTLKYISKTLDKGKIKLTPFEKSILRYCGGNGNKESAFRQWVIDNASNSSEIAKLAEMVQEWASKSDKKFNSIPRIILKEEINELVAQVSSLAKRLKLNKTEIATAGGCFEGEYFKSSFARAIRKEIPGTKVFGGIPPLEAGVKVLEQDNVWPTPPKAWNFSIQQSKAVTARKVDLIERKDSLALGIFGTARRFSAIIGKADGKIISSIKAKDPLAYGVIDSVSVSIALDRMCRKFDESDPGIINKVDYIQLYCSGAAGKQGQTMYEQVARRSIGRYLHPKKKLNTVKIDIFTDVEAVWITELADFFSNAKSFGGIVAMSGTGSIAYLKLPNRFDRQGGYGAPFPGDPGSSYEIGRRLLLWLHDALDSAGWPNPDKLPDHVNRFLIAVLHHFIKFSFEGKLLEGKELTPKDLINNRDLLRYLPSRCVLGTQKMRAALSDINQVATENLEGKYEEKDLAFLRNIRESVADELVILFKKLIDKDKNSIKEFINKQGIEYLPVILEGGSFNSKEYFERVKNGITEIGENMKINFKVKAAKYDSALGAYAMCCEKFHNASATEIIKEY